MTRRGWLLFAAMCLIWGIPYLLIKVAVGGVEAPVLVFARTAIGAVLLLPLALRRGELRLLRPYWRWVVLFAVVEMVGPWLFLSDAEQHLSSSLSGLLIAAVPILGVVLARLSGDRERITGVRWLGLGMGVAGVALLVGHGVGSGGAWPVTEALLTALGYAIGPLVVSRKLSGLPSLGLTASSLAVAAVIYVVPAAVTWPDRVPAAKVLGSIGALALICTALAFVLAFQLIAEVGPSRTVVITYVNPAVAVAAGVLVLGERFTVTMAVAFVVILVGSVLAVRSDRSAGSRRHAMILRSSRLWPARAQDHR